MVCSPRFEQTGVLLPLSSSFANYDSRGPLLFSLLLSFLLSRGAKDGQKEAVFSGVFAMVWVGSAVVTFQIKLLGGSV